MTAVKGTPEPWPLRQLVVRTPRLELRPDDDDGLMELVAQAYRGVHDPAMMPFQVPWTDAPAEELGRRIMQFYWSQRAELRPDRWSVHFLVRLDGAVIGTQGMAAKDFAVTRQVNTGSWLGRRHQGRGMGTEMRAAVLQLAFDHLGAAVARSDAFVDNRASHEVSRKLGYVADGTEVLARRGAAAVEQRLVLNREAFERHRPQWTAEVKGCTEDCRTMLGVSPGC
jgi:RimJ/RimL family protein N-acetyltransferase